MMGVVYLVAPKSSSVTNCNLLVLFEDLQTGTYRLH